MVVVGIDGRREEGVRATSENDESESERVNESE